MEQKKDEIITWPMGGEPPAGFKIADTRRRRKPNSEPSDTAVNEVQETGNASEAIEPPPVPERQSYVSTREPTAEDLVAMRILGGDPILRAKFQKWLENPANDDSRVFVQAILNEPGFEDSLPYDIPGESGPTTAFTSPQESSSFIPEPLAVPLIAGEEILLNDAPLLDAVPDSAPSTNIDPAVHRFIAGSIPTVDPGVLFTQLREPNDATTPPRPSIRERLARSLPILRPSETS